MIEDDDPFEVERPHNHWHDGRRLKVSERQRRYRAKYRLKRKLKGICMDCRLKAVPNYTQCIWHLEQRRAKKNSHPWFPGGPGRPPRGVSLRMRKIREKKEKSMAAKLRHLAMKEGLGRDDTSAFARFFKKRLATGRSIGKISEWMQNPSYEDLMDLAGESIKSLQDIVRNPSSVYKVTTNRKEGARHEAVGVDPGVPETPDDAGGDEPW